LVKDQIFQSFAEHFGFGRRFDVPGCPTEAKDMRRFGHRKNSLGMREPASRVWAGRIPRDLRTVTGPVRKTNLCGGESLAEEPVR
jgi:hypothetical protein